MKMTELLKTTSTSVSRLAGKTGLQIQKHSPEILLGIGIVGFVSTVVMACKATTHADEVLIHHRQKMNDINDAVKIAEEEPESYAYDEALVKQDKMIVYGKTTIEFVKLYAPTVAVGTLSLACILASRNIMQKRYLGAVAAYNAVSTAFETYRKRVREEAGELMDRHYRYGTELETFEVVDVDENGKKKKYKEVVEKTGTEKLSPDDTSRFFDKSNPNWDRNPEFSMFFLKGMQNYANDILHTRGHIFLNEVYDMLGFSHTSSGQVLGWVMGIGDDCVDFGLYDETYASGFVNGDSNTILLQFNHDGVIWDKI